VVAVQTVGFLPLKRDTTRTAERKLEDAERNVRAYAYASVMAVWHGWHEDRPGLFFILDGHPTAVASTFERLASGLHFATRVIDLG
jgi:hypothetical protein